MADNYISNVLAILRIFREAKKSSATISVRDAVQMGFGTATNTSSYARTVAALLDQAEGASGVISDLETFDDEVKNGLLETAGLLRNSLSLDNIGSQVQGYFPAIDSNIAQFSMLDSMIRGSIPSPRPAEVADLVAELEDFYKSLTDAEAPVSVKEILSRHVLLLIGLLKNIEAVGVDAAYAAYMELVLRLRREEARVGDKAKSFLSKAWPEIERWAGRLAIIDQAVNSATHLVGSMHSVQVFLEHLPK